MLSTICSATLTVGWYGGCESTERQVRRKRPSVWGSTFDLCVIVTSAFRCESVGRTRDRRSAISPAIVAMRWDARSDIRFVAVATRPSGVSVVDSSFT